MEEIQYSLEVFANNLRNYRKSKGLSQEKFSMEFTSLSEKSGRANMSQYELLQTLPPFELIFEFTVKTGKTMDALFSKEIDFSQPLAVNEPKDGLPYLRTDKLKEFQEKLDALWALNLHRAEKMEAWEVEIKALRSELEKTKAELERLKSVK